MKKIIALIIVLLIAFGLIIVKDKNNEKKREKERQEAYVIRNESTLLAYFEGNEESIEKDVESGELSDKAKEKIVEITDFVFYDKEINGTRFSELKEETKEKILGIVSSIDEAVENKVPNYKEQIKETIDENYPVVVESVKKGLTYIDDKLEEKIGKEKYDSIKEHVETAKAEIIETGKVVAEKTKEEIKDAKTKLKKWYEGWK